MNRAESLIEELKAFETTFSEEQRDQRELMQLLRVAGDNAFSRAHFNPGHITASGFVLDKEATQLLMVLHAKLGLWLQPGGHIEKNEMPLEAAQREVKEETNLTRFVVIPQLFDLDVHTIPAHGMFPEHKHFDLRYLFYVVENQPIEISTESLACKWVGVVDMDSFNKSASILRPVKKIQNMPESSPFKLRF